MLYPNYKHSATSGNLMLADPSHFIWRYGFENWGKENARMNMGKAAEQATHTALIRDLALDDVEAEAIRIFDEMQEGWVTEERDMVGPIARQFVETLREFGKPLTYQYMELVPGDRYGLQFDIKVVTDFGYDDCYIDTKATLRCPSAPKSDHIRQQALYAKLLGRPCRLLYGTPKKSALYPVDEAQAEQGFKDLLATFRRIEALDKLCPTPEDATRVIPLNLDTFYWDDDDKERARELWEIT